MAHELFDMLVNFESLTVTVTVATVEMAANDTIVLPQALTGFHSSVTGVLPNCP